MTDELTTRRQKKCAESWRGHDYQVTPLNFVECVKCGIRVTPPTPKEPNDN